MIDLSAIEARVNAATPGPWDLGPYGTSFTSRHTDRIVLAPMTAPASFDAEFIAHAREDVPALVAEVRRLRRDLATVVGWQGGDWQDGYEAGCAMSHSVGCGAVAAERDAARAEAERLREAWRGESEHGHSDEACCSCCYQVNAERAEAGRVREALQAANADWETRVEYGRKIGDGWVHEPGIKYASHQRTVHFRVDEAVLIDHWTYTDHRHPVEGCTHDRHDLTTQGAFDAALDGAE